MAIFSIKPLIHLNREVVKKWDGNSSLVVLFYAVTGSITPIFHDAVFLGTVSNAPTLSASSTMSAYQK